MTFAIRHKAVSLFECLLERGVVAPRNSAGFDDMLRRRRQWIEQAAALARRWRLPMTAIRTIHEYMIGFNWSVVYEALFNLGENDVCRVENHA